MANLENLEPKQVIQDMFAAFERGDMQTIVNTLAEDVDWVVVGDPEIMPWSGRYKGRQDVLKLMSNNAGATRDLKITPRWMVAEGDKVLMLINEKATVSPTGKAYDVDSLRVYTVRNGQIVAFENYFNPMPLLTATFGTPTFPGLPRKDLPRLKKEIWIFFGPDGQYHHWETFSYEYDSNWRKTQGRLENYNPAHRVAYIMTYEYDAGGNCAGEKWLNAANPEDAYTLSYRLDGKRIAGGKGIGATTWEFANDYDVWGRKLRMTNRYSSGNAWTFTYSYDETGRCVSGRGLATSGLTCIIIYEYEGGN